MHRICTVYVCLFFWGGGLTSTWLRYWGRVINLTLSVHAVGILHVRHVFNATMVTALV